MAKGVTDLSLSPGKLIRQAIDLVRHTKGQVVRNTNSLMVFTYIHLGKLIVESNQGGNIKATYGNATLKSLSSKLTKEFGSGFSVSNLEQMRMFYVLYQSRLPKSQPVAGKFANVLAAASISKTKSEPLAGKSFVNLFPLSWTHYAILCRIENEDERSFYEIELITGNWGKRELQRQLNSGLFERLALSKDKKKVKQLAAKGQIIETPADILKNPVMLEFLGLDEKTTYTETDLETAIINKIEHFLLEMGKGFLFQGRRHSRNWLQNEFPI